MRTWLPGLAAAGALMLAPQAALASGPSAGDNQYTDPLAGKTTSTTHHTKPPPPKTTSSPASTPPASTPPPAAPASGSTGTATPTPAPLASSTATTGTAAASTGTTAKHSKGTLPMTGFGAWLEAALGAALTGTGLALRRRRASSR
jgi:pilus assembly protein FimV